MCERLSPSLPFLLLLRCVRAGYAALVLGVVAAALLTIQAVLLLTLLMETNNTYNLEGASLFVVSAFLTIVAWICYAGTAALALDAMAPAQHMLYESRVLLCTRSFCVASLAFAALSFMQRVHRYRIKAQALHLNVPQPTDVSDLAAFDSKLETSRSC